MFRRAPRRDVPPHHLYLTRAAERRLKQVAHVQPVAGPLWRRRAHVLAAALPLRRLRGTQRHARALLRGQRVARRGVREQHRFDVGVRQDGRLAPGLGRAPLRGRVRAQDPGRRRLHVLLHRGAGARGLRFGRRGDFGPSSFPGGRREATPSPTRVEGAARRR